MKKTSSAQVLVFSLLIAFASVAIAQMAEKGWKKTVTLPSGEVILDMNGEWDVLYEYHGMYSGLRTHTQTAMITQKGNTFVAVQQTESEWWPKGSETIKGELERDGFKTVHVNRDDVGWVPCKWEISENGNKIVLDDERIVRATLTRR